MQFFTPHLYQQFNSLDEAEAARAYEAWEQAIVDYKRQLESVKDRLPSQILALSELCLHDAEVVKREEIIQAAGPIFCNDQSIALWGAVAVLTLQLNGEFLSLFYSLRDRVRTREAPSNWRFSKLKEHWLYDEIHPKIDGRFATYLHNILLSTGVELEIPFSSVVVHRFSMPSTSALSEKKTA